MRVSRALRLRHGVICVLYATRCGFVDQTPQHGVVFSCAGARSSNSRVGESRCATDRGVERGHLYALGPVITINEKSE